MNNQNNGYRQNQNVNPPRVFYKTSDFHKGYSNRTTLVVLALLFLLAGILLTAVQVAEHIKYNKLVGEGNSCTAYVTDVDKYTRTVTSKRKNSMGRRTKRKETYYDVTATYIVDHQEYHIEFESSKAYSYSDSFKIYYEEENPSNYVREGDDGGLPYGIVFLLIGGVISVVELKKHFEEKELEAMGLL